MKLLDEETILIGQYPTGVADGPQIEANIQYIQSNYQTCYGRPYKIVRIPMPPNSNGQYPPSSDYFTYTNSTFINKTILVPTYGFPQDTTALRIYRENLPGYTVIGYDCNAIIPAAGAIHCITKEIGTSNPVLIAHARLQNTTDTVNNYSVLANIKNKFGIDSAQVYWRTDTNFAYNRVVMTNSGGQNWVGAIPHQSAGKSVYYYIKTRTNTGKYFSKPITAPAGYWKFIVLGPTGIAGNENIPDKFALYQNYPNPFNPSTKFKVQIARLRNGQAKLSEIKLIVYDILGREVKIIANKRFMPGVYEFEFNGSEFPSGIYFYKLIAENYTETRKMALVK
jgi:agmatine deiminase